MQVIQIKNEYSTQLNAIKNEIIYAADGGLNHVISNKICYQKLFWFGDADSLSNKTQKILDNPKNNHNNNKSMCSYIEKSCLAKEKNFSDFSALIDNIRDESKEHLLFLEIYFGLGGRKDHENANILEIEQFILSLPNGGICYFQGGIVISSLDFSILNADKMKFSVFSKKYPSHIQISGAQYSGDIILERPSHGLSNNALGNKVKIKPNSNVITVYF